MAYTDNKYSDFALLLLRIAVGTIFILAGWGKLTSIANTQVFLGNVGIPFPEIMAWVVAATEFFGGIMVILGAYAKLFYVLLAIVMAVAIITTKLGGDFNAARLDIMLLVSSLVLLFIGSGNYSVDYKIANR